MGSLVIVLSCVKEMVHSEKRTPNFLDSSVLESQWNLPRYHVRSNEQHTVEEGLKLYGAN